MTTTEALETGYSQTTDLRYVEVNVGVPGHSQLKIQQRLVRLIDGGGGQEESIWCDLPVLHKEDS